MKRTIKTEKLPIYIWTDSIEEGALQQTKNLANHPYAFHHIAIMPDVHSGYGMPIGGVLATKEVIIPNAVGVDIGCGMCAIKSDIQFSDITIDEIKTMMGRIRGSVPVGFQKHKQDQNPGYMPKLQTDGLPIVSNEYKKALKQIGTLGGGNHFIDLLKDQEEYIWIMIHSGSRNIGYTVANHYNKLAINNRSKYSSNIPTNWELDYLPLDSEQGQLYIEEMRYCVEFALCNRKLMMERVMDIVHEILARKINWDEMINIAHNYAELEEHFGEKVWIHRKGATKAYKGELGIIPGSQGTPSYIVKGKGNLDSFKSCSHGAGRVMSRSKAIRELNMDEEVKKLENKGVLHGIRGRKSLDEAPSAYKDIDKVIKEQEDLIEIIAKLEPVAVIKE